MEFDSFSAVHLLYSMKNSVNKYFNLENQGGQLVESYQSASSKLAKNSQLAHCSLYSILPQLRQFGEPL